MSPVPSSAPVVAFGRKIIVAAQLEPKRRFGALRLSDCPTYSTTPFRSCNNTTAAAISTPPPSVAIVSRCRSTTAPNSAVQKGSTVLTIAVRTGPSTLSPRRNAVNATAEDARLLGIEPGRAILRERRRTTDPQGRPLEWSEDRYVGDGVAFTVRNSLALAPLTRDRAVAEAGTAQ